MVGVAGIQVGDAASTMLRRARLRDRLVELRMLGVANPIVRRTQRKVRILFVSVVAAFRELQTDRARVADAPALGEIGFRELGSRA